MRPRIQLNPLSPGSLLLLAALVLLGFFEAPTRTSDRAVAITFDDLPATAAGMPARDVASLQDVTRRLLATINRYNIPAVGFVTEHGLFVDDTSESRIGALRMWLDAGLELGNHTYSHRDLNSTPLEEFEADTLRGAAVTRQLMEERGHALRYFRHPFLHVGRDIGTRRAFEAFLADHGYIVAPVTVDTDDFVYAAAYASALRRNNPAAASRIAADYPRYMEEVFSYFEEVSRRVTGREIPQVVLLHANRLNADRFDQIAGMLVRRGYRFVSLSQALADPAYQLRDDFVGAPSNSWFNHWEVTAGRKPIPTPAAPAWLTAR